MSKSTLSLNEKHKDFFDSVYAIVREIPLGKVTSYGAIAQCLGAKHGSRMVGWAMNAAHSNPTIPAHRVVNRNGLLTGKNHFSSPTEMQERLEKEGVSVKEDQIENFKNHFWNPSEELSSF